MISVCIEFVLCLAAKVSRESECHVFNNNNNKNKNKNKVQTNTAAPLQDILFLCLYKGVEKICNPIVVILTPPRKQPANMYFYQ